MEVRQPDDPGETPPAPGRRSPWILSQDALQGLLSALDTDPGRAGEKYERLRQKLIVFFLGRGCEDPEDNADETLDRVSRRLVEGEAIRDVGLFAYGVARHVLSESARRHRQRQSALHQHFAAQPTGTQAQASEAAIECIQRCLRGLDDRDRELIIAYYEGDGRARQNDRRELADHFGISTGALRLRVHRIRRLLEGCTRHCLRGGPESGVKGR
jgi:RNA polymerase sigma factor (sigma-70 family)